MDAREKTATPDKLHSVESAAELLGGVAPSTIRAWLSQGRLTRVKIGRLTRIREYEILSLIGPRPDPHTLTFARRANRAAPPLGAVPPHITALHEGV